MYCSVDHVEDPSGRQWSGTTVYRVGGWFGYRRVPCWLFHAVAAIHPRVRGGWERLQRNAVLGAHGPAERSSFGW